jgi:RIO kinase 1
MEYIGDESGPAPQLKDVILEDPTEMYDEVLSFIIDGWRDAHLVHGDLSEYNVLVWDGELIMIDCGQAMTNDFFNAKDLLVRDINNVNRFFRNRGADVIDLDKVLEETLNGTDDGEVDEE